MEWATLPLKRYAEFSGRSRRKEYWMFVLLLIAVYVVASILDTILGLNTMIAGMYGPFYLIATLALLVPSLAVSVRRLHDTNRSGWWLLILIVPEVLAIAVLLSGNLVVGGILGFIVLVAAIILIVFMVLDGTAGPNKYGEDPKAAERAATPTTT